VLSLKEAVAALRDRGLLPPEHGECVPFTGGSESIIGAVLRNGQPDRVVKINRPEHLATDAVPFLYNQTVACLWHHPHDLPQYQAAWPEWAALLR
jgi:hypothetical protein